VLWKPLISECSPKDWLLSSLLLMTMHAPQRAQSHDTRGQ